MFSRFCSDKVKLAIQDSPVVIICGARQCGKTTLVQNIKQKDWQYLTLDDYSQLEAAKRDPVGFIRNLTANHIIIDEVHRVPELFLAIKQAVDENRIYGKYLLTGSANVLALPKIADSLAGRTEIITLMPLAECEVRNKESTFLKKILSNKVPTTDETRIRDVLIQKIISGGFPEPLKRQENSRKMVWHNQYVNSITQKDVKDIGNIEHLSEIPKLVRLLSNQVGKLTNFTEIAGSIGLSRNTMVKYISILEKLYLFEEVSAWHKNENKRMIKTSKVHIIDTGLLCSLKRINYKKLKNNPILFGELLESYIYCELRRLATWFEEPLYFYHYRDKDQVEVDIVIETVSGDVIGIESKAKSSITKKDFIGLKQLKKIAGINFKMGILLYDGDHNVQYEDDIYASPIASLWE